MYLSSINPHIRVAMQSIIPAGHNIMRRIIYDYELIYLERGEFTFVYGEKPYHCQSGDIIFIRPGIPHSFQLDCTEISQPHIHFDITSRPLSEKIPVSFKDIDAMTESERNWIHTDYFSDYAVTPFITVTNKEKFLDVFYQIISKETDPLMKKAFMVQLLSLFINTTFPNILEECAPLNVAHQIKDYIDSGNGIQMSLDDFAKRFSYSKFYLEKKFKSVFGISLIEYRNQKRMDYANQLLQKHSVTRVADELGYTSIYSFSRAYRKHFGYSPRKHK
ncbi:MAG: AraC family transcriptional regulator [Clostridia bacterium]|nr:AraC family transcriptional regulator [Clostridia bacterium]